jgi:hypothetical protein
VFQVLQDQTVSWLRTFGFLSIAAVSNNMVDCVMEVVVPITVNASSPASADDIIASLRASWIRGQRGRGQSLCH